MVIGIEGVGGHVVSIGRLVVSHFLGGGYGKEVHIAAHLVGSLDLLATLSLGEPSAEGEALSYGDVLLAKGECADGRLSFHLLGAKHFLRIGIVVGQRELGVQLGDLILGQGTYGHIGTIAHAGDGKRRSLAGIVEHVDVITIILPAAGRRRGLRGHFLTFGVGHLDG